MRPSTLDDGGISGLFSSGGPSVRFLTRYDGEVSEPLVGRQGNWRWEGPLGTPLGLVHWKRASSPVEAGTAGYL